MVFNTMFVMANGATNSNGVMNNSTGFNEP